LPQAISAAVPSGSPVSISAPPAVSLTTWPEDLKSRFPVGVLGAFRLALHHNPGGQVGYADSGISLIHMLPPCTAGAVGINADILRIDVHIYVILDLRQYFHRGKTGMAPSEESKGEMRTKRCTPFSALR